MSSTYDFTLKEGPKMKIENFLGTKSWRKILEELKQKVDIFIWTKTYLTQKNIILDKSYIYFLSHIGHFDILCYKNTQVSIMFRVLHWLHKF